jgi:hypothetical protein
MQDIEVELNLKMKKETLTKMLKAAKKNYKGELAITKL